MSSTTATTPPPPWQRGRVCEAPRGPRHRVPDRAGSRAGDRRQDRCGEDPADRHRHSAPSRNLLRRRQLPRRLRGRRSVAGQLRFETYGRATPTRSSVSTLPEAGLLVQSRITGAFEGVRGGIPDLPVECFVRLDGRGIRDRSRKLVSDFLERHPRDRHILVAAVNDTSALGALDAAATRVRNTSPSSARTASLKQSQR